MGKDHETLTLEQRVGLTQQYKAGGAAARHVGSHGAPADVKQAF